MRFLPSLSLLVVLSVPGCTCKQSVKQIPPSLHLTPTSVDFGPVKSFTSMERELKLEAVTNTPVLFSEIALEGADAASFSIVTAPHQVDALSSTVVSVRFSPVELRPHTATLLLRSNDAESPETRVPLTGEGARPVLAVRPDCASTRNCVGMVSVSPLAIDFAPEPVERLMELDPSRLPTVFVTNDGPVTLVVTRVAIEGPDAAAFTFAGSLPAAGAEFTSMTGFNVPVRFRPMNEQQATYQASLVLESDDPQNQRVTVALRGVLRPNLPPTVCANLVRVVPPPEVGGPRDYGTSAHWDEVRVAPVGGYDFRLTRDLRPGELGIFSAISDPGDPTACTADPEDGRTGLTFSWSLVEAPVGAMNLPVSGTTTGQVQLRPFVTGEYALELTVKDVQGHTTTVRVRFAAAFKQDLVAQLQWTGAQDVDLDVHLVRPSAMPDGGDAFGGVFSPFVAGPAGRTSGDINGYSVTIQRAPNPAPDAGLPDFDWGEVGINDDPALNVDDTGTGPLLENVSLNFPENDARCVGAACTYGVFVHYFRDTRVPMTVACILDGGADCRDGEACTCATGSRCVADLAPKGDAGLGAGRCFVAPKPVVRLFFRGSAVASNIIPLDTLTPPDELAIGAPCQVLHVADIHWPRRGTFAPDGGKLPPTVTIPGTDSTGRMTSPQVARFGWRQAGATQCAPDAVLGGRGWYSRQP